MAEILLAKCRDLKRNSRKFRGRLVFTQSAPFMAKMFRLGDGHNQMPSAMQMRLVGFPTVFIMLPFYKSVSSSFASNPLSSRIPYRL